MKVLEKLTRLLSRTAPPEKWPGARIAQAARIIDTHGPISIGTGTEIMGFAEVSTEDYGKIWIGENCRICTGALLLTYGGYIKIGNNCSVNPYTVLYGQGGLTIGDGVRIAAHTVIIPANHNFSDREKPIYQQGLTKKGVVIEDDVWIAAGVRILDGVTIGRGSVIGAGAVVTRDTPPFSINVGVPSKVIAYR